MLGVMEYVPSSRMGLPISSRTTILDPYGDISCRSRFSLQKRDILLLAHALENWGPHAHTDLAQVRLLEQQHLRAGLPNAPTNAERQLVDTACHLDEQRHRHHHQIECLTQLLLDVVLDGKDGLLRFPGGEAAYDSPAARFFPAPRSCQCQDQPGLPACLPLPWLWSASCLTGWVIAETY